MYCLVHLLTLTSQCMAEWTNSLNAQSLDELDDI